MRLSNAWSWSWKQDGNLLPLIQQTITRIRSNCKVTVSEVCTWALISTTVAQVTGPSTQRLQDLMYNSTSDKLSLFFFPFKKEKLSGLVSTTTSLGCNFVQIELKQLKVSISIIAVNLWRNIFVFTSDNVIRSARKGLKLIHVQTEEKKNYFTKTVLLSKISKIRGDMMTWQGKVNEHATRQRLIHHKQVYPSRRS